MMYLPHLLVLFGTWVVFIVSPGPSFATTVHYEGGTRLRA